VNQVGATRDVPSVNAVRSDGDAPSTPERRTVTESSNVLPIIGMITSQVVFITALFYYFGWVYTRSYFNYFGIDTSLVGYGTADYVLHSINVAFRPFVYLAFAALASLAFHRLVMAPALMRATSDLPNLSNTTSSGVTDPVTLPRSSRPGLGRLVGLVVSSAWALGHWRLGLSGIRWIIGVSQAVALALAGVVFIGLLFFEQFGASLGLLLPLSLMLSVSLLGYIVHVRSTHSDVFAATMPPWRTASSRAYGLILLALGLVAGLWVVGVYGDQVGTRLATNTAAQLPIRPGIIVYSTGRIALNGPGVDVREIAQPDSKYHYQYTGLRLLVRASDKLLLLPASWQHGHDRVLLIRDDDSIRIDIAAW
jgi:hypothetical protein